MIRFNLDVVVLMLRYPRRVQASKELSDRKCAKCHMITDHRGVLKAAPTAVPAVNPSTGQRNSTYGYGDAMSATPSADVMQARDAFLCHSK